MLSVTLLGGTDDNGILYLNHKANHGPVAYNKISLFS